MAPIPQQQQKTERSPFGTIACSVPITTGVFDGRRGGKSTVMIQCSVPILSIGCAVETAVWARLTTKADGDEITFEAALPRGFRAEDETAADTFKAAVESAAAAWNGYGAAEAAAIARLTGQKKAGGVERKGLAPRHVKRAAVAA